AENPERPRAEEFIDSGEYYWNSGMFLFGARRYLEELQRLVPDIAAACEKAFGSARRDLAFTRVANEPFEACRSESIDYAVMEKATDAAVVPIDAGWSDVGSWSSLHEACRKDGDGNVLHGDVLAEATRNSYLYASSRLVAAVGLEDYVVIE